MPISEDEAEKQKQEENFNESGVQVLDKTNSSNNKINVGDIVTCWNNGDKEKQNLFISKLYVVKEPYTVPAYEAIALNTTRYAKIGSNKLKNIRSWNYCKKRDLIKKLKFHFSHREKKPYIVQVFNESNSKEKIKCNNIITVWNNGDKEKQNLLLINAIYSSTFQKNYQLIALNKTKYAEIGNNGIRNLKFFAYDRCSQIIRALDKGYDHVEKEPYVTIPIQHN